MASILYTSLQKGTEIIVSVKVNGHHISDSPTELKLDVKPKEVIPSVPSYSKVASVTSNYLLPTISGVPIETVRYDHHSRSSASLTSLKTPPFSKSNYKLRKWSLCS